MTTNVSPGLNCIIRHERMTSNNLIYRNKLFDAIYVNFLSGLVEIQGHTVYQHIFLLIVSTSKVHESFCK